jgi:hypothetical protein
MVARDRRASRLGLTEHVEQGPLTRSIFFLTVAFNCAENEESN